MKNNVTGRAKQLGGLKTESYVSFGRNTPPYNKIAALPKNMNKPLLKRLVEWFKA